ncbi:ROK family transcriptional regulator [Arthrobacter sp. NPDC080031]|uniref:ROK family transcriptional regulator n=1 Tax=Arthrobacter sp. NPDC080031 TaxID=3155918 RepID=UPI00344D5D0E
MVQDTRELNRKAVLTALMMSRPASRKWIAEASGISAATVTRAVDQLIAEGIVTETAEIISESRGRRAVELDVVSNRSFVIGVDLGASNVRLVVADLLARPLLALEIATPTATTASELAQWLASTARASAGDVWDRVEHLCVGLPGAVSQQKRTISNAPNLAQIEVPTFLDDVEKSMGRPVGFDNDANYALLGEQHFGAARSASNAAMVTIGSGLGAGLAIDGRILQGDHGLIGEFGQLPVGPLGTRLEHMVTGAGIIRRAAEAGIDLAGPNQLFASDAGPALKALRAHFDQALLIVLTATTVSCDPQTIVLGGGIANSLASNLDRYQTALEQNLRASPRLAAAELGDFSGAVGAVVAALHRVYADLGIEEEAFVSLPGGDALTHERVQAARR